MDPGFYPKPPSEVTHKETHISHLFFAGDLVYKVKKAIRFPFLDYSKLNKRRYFLYEEMRLNRRLAPSVYLAVLPISSDCFGWHLGGDDPALEYALVMRRLPEKRMLDFLVESGQATAEMMRSLAALLAPFHALAERSKIAEPLRQPEIVKKLWLENLADVEPFLNGLMSADTFHAIKEFGIQFAERHNELFVRRAAEGWIRDVHGDLHCEHVCFAPEGIQIFDCIEFSARFRCCDVASEIAFLLMDLEARGAEALAGDFLGRYLELIGDGDLTRLLPFYKCYRALVRGKVEALRSRRPEASRYFRLAARAIWEPAKPFLVIIGGLTGSGKSTLARELGERLGIPVISSDSVRKTLAGAPGGQAAPFGEGIYGAAMTEKTYAEMAREAERRIDGGTGAILDATFSRRADRERIARLAEKRRVPLNVIFCRASEETVRRRLARRAAEGRDLSDGRWEIYVEQKAKLQPFEEIPTRLTLGTEDSIERLVRECEKFLRSRLSEPGAQSEVAI
jgi:hypothetical protein